MNLAVMRGESEALTIPPRSTAPNTYLALATASHDTVVTACLATQIGLISLNDAAQQIAIFLHSPARVNRLVRELYHNYASTQPHNVVSA